MTDDSPALEAPLRTSAQAEPPPKPSAFWLSDLTLTRHGLRVRKSGRRIGLAEIAPRELVGFTAYFAVVIAKGLVLRLRRPRRLAVWFAPDRPRPWYVIWSALTLAGIAIAPSEAEATAGFYFEDVTVGEAPHSQRRLLNADCRDISKSRVAQVFGRVAGYDLLLDPETYEGLAVEKSEGNGLHDGRLVMCPRARLVGRTYQRFVDTSRDGTAYDLRTTVIDRRPVCVLVKTKPASTSFSIHNRTVTYRELDEVFSPEEIDLLTRFAEAMALDWAALDVLRDADGRIYVVDVNKTDTGPAVDLTWADRRRLLAVLTHGLSAMVARG